MNPLDTEELKAFFKIIKKDMPLHTDTTADIPYPFSQGLPKNVMEISNKIDNKFLNDNLHTIEEMEYRKKGITNDFKNYQKKYYDESGILNHDLYFEHEGKIYPKVRGASFFSQNSLSFSNASLNRTTGGTEVFTTTTEISTLSVGLNNDRLGASVFAGTPTNGAAYNQIALHNETFAHTANYRLGVADDNSAPNNIYSGSDTGSIAIPTTAQYTYKPMTSAITLTQSTAWAVWNVSGTCVIFTTALAGAWKEHLSSSFGALPSTFGSIDGTIAYIIPVKMKYV